VAEQVTLDGDAFRRPAGKLSGGMRRRLSIAISVVGGHRVLFLDEPTTNLDPEARKHIWEIVYVTLASI
jgi:ABC-type multidrug transport system ATPase subunit